MFSFKKKSISTFAAITYRPIITRTAYSIGLVITKFRVRCSLAVALIL